MFYVLFSVDVTNCMFLKVKPVSAKLNEIYVEAEELIKARQQTVSEDDVLAGLREAMNLLFTNGSRPDSGFSEVDYRSEVNTPEPGGEDGSASYMRKGGGGGRPVYYNENNR